MNKLSTNASVESPLVSPQWLIADKQLLKNKMHKRICQEAGKYDLIELLHLKNDGQVIVNFRTPVGPELRGGILLDLEELLKTEFDQGITVWLEPLGDKNSLRNLRGIEVKKHD